MRLEYVFEYWSMARLPEPACPPIVALVVGYEIVAAYLLCWEEYERDGSRQAWVTWVRYRNDQPFRHVVAVRAGCVRPLQEPGAYRDVPRRIVGRDGQVRRWQALGGGLPAGASRAPRQS